MSQRTASWIGIGLVAALWLLLSLLGLGLSLVLFLAAPLSRVRSGAPVTLGGMSFLSLLLAGGLLYTAWGALHGRPSSSWLPAKTWLWLGGLALLTLVTGGLIPAHWQTSWLFTPIHTGQIIFTALTLMAAAASAAGPASPTRRQWTLTLSWGAFSTLPAIFLELVAGVTTLMILAVLMVLLPDGQAILETWQKQLEALQATGTIDPAIVQEWLRSPYILGTLAFMLGAVTPVLEELIKTLPVALLTRREKGASLTRAYLWGLACGAGFAMIEGIGNGGSSLGTASGGWLTGVLSRIPATAMHMVTSGLVGLGWAYAWRGKYGHLGLAYLLAMGFHSLWNLLAVSLLGGTAFINTSVTPGLPEGISLLALLALGIQAISALLLVPLVPLALRRLDPLPPVLTPAIPDERASDESGEPAGTMAL